jgi:hypothetical protein
MMMTAMFTDCLPQTALENETAGTAFGSGKK